MEKEIKYHGFLPYHVNQLRNLLNEIPDFDTTKWKIPKIIAESKKQARPGYNSCSADEYEEDEETLKEKIKLLAAILKNSKKFCVYSGAGISTAAGIGDYASRAENSVGFSQNQRPELWSEFDAKPTLSHCILTQLHQLGYLKYWIQQNHDGLPQKAGFPQHCINEIHGAWYDPSNPVVQMSGQLRSDLFDNLMKWENETDFCLTVGTSLAGMNADRVVVSAANRAIQQHSGHFGSAIISVQQTALDELASLRFFCKIDDAMRLLAIELQIPIPEIPFNFPFVINPQFIREEDVFILRHYNADGKRIEDDDQLNHKSMILDLREDAEVKITVGQFEGHSGVVTGKNKENHYRLRIFHPLKNNFKAPKVHTLGLWWVYEAVTGDAPYLPIVNIGDSLKFVD